MWSSIVSVANSLWLATLPVLKVVGLAVTGLFILFVALNAVLLIPVRWVRARRDWSWRRVPGDDGSGYKWRWKQIPAGDELRNRSIFVVHGIGEQVDNETAVRLRNTVEEVVDDVHRMNGEVTPTPFICDAYWGDYAHFKKLAKKEFKELKGRQRKFFVALWKSRTQGPLKSWWWMARVGTRLIFTRDVMMYIALIPSAVLGSLVLLARPGFRRLFDAYVSDARVYLDPSGPMEKDFARRIDRYVAEQFLRQLGTNWDLDDLDEGKWRLVSGEPHRFTEIVWVAHSLGTVISYNAISEILHRCKWARENGTGSREVVQRVEWGLHGFVTLGSPLDKIIHLYQDREKVRRLVKQGSHDRDAAARENTTVLKPWPEEYLPEGEWSLWRHKDRNAGQFLPLDPEDRRPFWTNYHDVADPISGALERFGKAAVVNRHPTGIHLPMKAHLDYMTNRKLVRELVNDTYDGEVVADAQPFPTSGALAIRARAAVGIFIWLALATIYLAVAVAVVQQALNLASWLGLSAATGAVLNWIIGVPGTVWGWITGLASLAGI